MLHATCTWPSRRYPRTPRAGRDALSWVNVLGSSSGGCRHRKIARSLERRAPSRHSGRQAPPRACKQHAYKTEGQRRKTPNTKNTKIREREKGIAQRGKSPKILLSVSRHHRHASTSTGKSSSESSPFPGSKQGAVGVSHRVPSRGGRVQGPFFHVHLHVISAKFASR